MFAPVIFTSLISRLSSLLAYFVPVPLMSRSAFSGCFLRHPLFYLLLSLLVPVPSALAILLSLVSRLRSYPVTLFPDPEPDTYWNPHFSYIATGVWLSAAIVFNTCLVGCCGGNQCKTWGGLCDYDVDWLGTRFSSVTSTLWNFDVPVCYDSLLHLTLTRILTSPPQTLLWLGVGCPQGHAFLSLMFVWGWGTFFGMSSTARVLRSSWAVFYFLRCSMCSSILRGALSGRQIRSFIVRHRDPTCITHALIVSDAWQYGWIFVSSPARITSTLIASDAWQCGWILAHE